MKFFIIFIFLFTNSLFSQNLKKNELLIPYRDGKLWGLCDTLGVVKVKPFADEVLDFKINDDFSGKYTFRVNTINKIIDNKENVLLENKEYDSISIQYFNSGIEVYKKKKVGVVLNGKEIIPCIYDRINEIQNGSYEVIKNDKYGLINSFGKMIIPVKYYAIDFSDKMNTDSDKFIWQASYKSRKKVDYFYDDIRRRNEPLYSELGNTFVKKSQQQINDETRNNFSEIHKKYDYIREIIDGRLAIVENPNNSATTIEEMKKVGVISIINKKEIIPLDYTGISYITNEKGKAIFVLSKNNKSIFADEDLEQILPTDFDDVINYNESVYIIKKNNKWGAKIFHTVYQYIPIKYKSINLARTIRINKHWSFNIFEVELENGEKGFVGENGVEYFKN